MINSPLGVYVPAPPVKRPICKRALKILAKAGIKDVYDLTDTSEATLRKLRGMGHGLVHEIKWVLEENGMSLASGEPTHWSGWILCLEHTYFVHDARLHFGERSAAQRMERLEEKQATANPTPTFEAGAAFGAITSGQIQFPPIKSTYVR